MSDGVRRVEALVRAARVLADPESELGRHARRVLAPSTGLSPAGVELAFTRCLETEPSAAELATLVASVRPAPRVHVILPANVFVAAHRAIALALAASPRVFVRPSRREPHFARLLAEATPGLFELTDEIRPDPGDHVWAYGGDASLGSVRSALPAGVTLHARGPGYGVAVIDAAHVTAATAALLASDIVPFEQRGCLSPRLALVVGATDLAERFAWLAAEALGEASERVPLGRLDDAELADARAFRDAYRYAAVLFAAGPGVVASSATERWGVAPSGRHLVVAACSDPSTLLAKRAPELTTVGVAAVPTLRDTLRECLPHARVVPLGTMQRPTFDGPADRRP